MTELKPCPFCGGKAELLIAPPASELKSKWLVICKNHCVNQYPHTSETSAIEAWNKRAEPTEQPKKSYTKADYMMCLHKEYGCNFILAEEAHNKALEYLRDKAMMHG